MPPPLQVVTLTATQSFQLGSHTLTVHWTLTSLQNTGAVGHGVRRPMVILRLLIAWPPNRGSPLACPRGEGHRVQFLGVGPFFTLIPFDLRANKFGPVNAGEGFYGLTVETCGNGFRHSHSLPFPSIQFPFPPIPIPIFWLIPIPMGFPCGRFPFPPIPILSMLKMYIISDTAIIIICS